jgi:hypothetical protein
MNFTSYDFGHSHQGDVIEVKISANANVRILDATNFRAYSEGRPYRYLGGHYRQSPVRLAVPYSGHWHAVVDLQGLRGSVRSSAQKFTQ